jgi:hypothetical protein
VVALVSDGWQQPILELVLEVADAGLAHRVACALAGLRVTPDGPAVLEEVQDVTRLLPESAREEFRIAVAHLTHLRWPKPRQSPRQIDEGHIDRFHSDEDEEERSPELATLGELSGPVVRIWRLTELHVFDTERFLHAAAATGRLHAEPDDPEVLTQAAAVLLDDEEGLPGADNILDTYLGAVLDPTTDELADFRPAETPEFDTGTRAEELRNRRPQ